MTIKPNLERIGCRTPATLIVWPFVCTTRGMGLDRIRFSPLDVDTPAIRFPTGNTGCKLFVGIRDTLVIFLAVFVFLSVRIGIAPTPEILDKIFALFVGRQRHERALFVLCDDVGYVIIKPTLVGLL